MFGILRGYLIRGQRAFQGRAHRQRVRRSVLGHPRASLRTVPWLLRTEKSLPRRVSTEGTRNPNPKSVPHLDSWRAGRKTIQMHAQTLSRAIRPRRARSSGQRSRADLLRRRRPNREAALFEANGKRVIRTAHRSPIAFLA